MSKLAYASSLSSLASSVSSKQILKKTVHVASSTLASRLLGLVREMLMVRFLGAGILADAFFTAFKIPNSLRKIFAEGALSAALVPTLVSVHKQEGPRAVSSCVSLVFLLFQGILTGVCIGIFVYADTVIRIVAPGWFITASVTSHAAPGIWSTVLSYLFPALFFEGATPEVAVYAARYLKVLIAFIICLSSSSVLTGALQAVRHFFVSAIAPIILNISFIVGLLVCLWAHWSVERLCLFILAGGVIQFLMHVVMYLRLGFTFTSLHGASWRFLRQILVKFLPLLLSMSIMEVNLFIGTSMATYCAPGSIACLYYANRFMGIPLGVFATAFSTILLPYIAYIHTSAQRLSFFLLEASKLVAWVTLPATVVMSFLSHKIFLTLFLSDKFTHAHVEQSAYILIAFLSGLFIFSVNKIVQNFFYTLPNTAYSLSGVSLATIFCYYFLSRLLVPRIGVVGLAYAMVGAYGIKTVILLGLLHTVYGLTVYLQPFCRFLLRVAQQTLISSVFFLSIHYGISAVIILGFTSHTAYFLQHGLGFWLWVGPLCVLYGWSLYKTRNFYGIKIYFVS